MGYLQLTVVSLCYCHLKFSSEASLNNKPYKMILRLDWHHIPFLYVVKLAISYSYEEYP
jgi:hypothetical protein